MLKPILLLTAILAVAIEGYSLKSPQEAGKPELRRDYTAPLKFLPEENHPNFADDLDFDNIETAISRQLVRFGQKNLTGVVRLGDRVIPQAKFMETLEEFQSVVRGYKRCLSRGVVPRRVCITNLNRDIANRFDVYKPDLQAGDNGHNEDKFAWFTAYYTPTLAGQPQKSDEFPWGIYTKPDKNNLAKKTREQIDFRGALDGRGFDLFYSPDLFELYLLHVEGGGKVAVENPDGSVSSFYLSYDGTNGKSWNFISRYMREKGYIADGSIISQRQFLEANPDKWREIYRTCPSYVYFKITEDPPLGNDSVSLSDNRSIATDRNFYKFKGMLSFVQTKRLKPDAEDGETAQPGEDSFMEFSRFMLDQDTGGAIRGKARVDLYFGEDDYAALASQHVNTNGRLYYLVKK